MKDVKDSLYPPGWLERADRLRSQPDLAGNWESKVHWDEKEGQVTGPDVDVQQLLFG